STSGLPSVLYTAIHCGWAAWKPNRLVKLHVIGLFGVRGPFIFRQLVIRFALLLASGRRCWSGWPYRDGRSSAYVAKPSARTSTRTSDTTPRISRPAKVRGRMRRRRDVRSAGGAAGGAGGSAVGGGDFNSSTLGSHGPSWDTGVGISLTSTCVSRPPRS